MSFLGKEYTLVNQENMEGFVNSLGSKITEDYKKVLLFYKPTTRLVKNGDNYVLTSSRPDNTTSEINFQSGVEFDEKAFDHTAKTTYTVDGNTVTQVQKFDAEGVVLTFKREFSDNELVLTITSNVWDGVAKRLYKAI